MIIRDARSGKRMAVGDVAEYGNGESLRLLAVDDVQDRVFVEHTYRDHSGAKPVPNQKPTYTTITGIHADGRAETHTVPSWTIDPSASPLRTIRSWVPLAVHKLLFFKLTGYIPT